MSRIDYTVDLSAERGVDVIDFTVEYPGFRGHIPDFGVSEGMVYMSVAAPIPEMASCSWRTEGGEFKSLSVPVASLLPQEFDAARDKLIFSVLNNESIALSVGLRFARFCEESVTVSVFSVSGESPSGAQSNN